MNPWIHFDSIRQFSKDSFCGFDSRCGFQKICVADSICGAVFKKIRFADSICRFDLWCGFQKIRQILTKPANPQESLVHRRTLDKQILNFWIRESVLLFKRFVLRIRFVMRFSKDLFRRFDSWCSFQKIRFPDLFREKKIPKLLDLFLFGRIRVRFPHPYKITIIQT